MARPQGQQAPALEKAPDGAPAPEQTPEQAPPVEDPTPDTPTPDTPAKVKPRRYTDADFPAGGFAPFAVYQAIDRTGAAVGKPTTQVPERGHVVIAEGDAVDDRARRALGLS